MDVGGVWVLVDLGGMVLLYCFGHGMGTSSRRYSTVVLLGTWA